MTKRPKNKHLEILESMGFAPEKKRKGKRKMTNLQHFIENVIVNVYEKGLNEEEAKQWVERYPDLERIGITPEQCFEICDYVYHYYVHDIKYEWEDEVVKAYGYPIPKPEDKGTIVHVKTEYSIGDRAYVLVYGDSEYRVAEAIVETIYVGSTFPKSDFDTISYALRKASDGKAFATIYDERQLSHTKEEAEERAREMNGGKR